MRRLSPVVAVCALATLGCHDAATSHALSPASPSGATLTTVSSSPATSAPTTTPTPSPAATRATTHAAATAPAFAWRSSRVTAAALAKSWHRGCPVAPSGLRAVTLTFWGFDNRAHSGTLVVNVSAVRPIVDAFRRIYAARFPIRRMTPIAAYGGDDNKSMAADNTSAFNCRYAVANGPKQWSMHAYGDAVDIDTLENPYTLDGRVYPPAGKPYTDRHNVRRGMIVPGSPPVRAFSAVGWGWGGRWSSSPDYQHFSSNGK